MKWSAVIVTRGDVDLSPILSTLRDADEIVIRKGHEGVWERWEAALEAAHEIVYTQDDDCVVNVDEVMAAALTHRAELVRAVPATAQYIPSAMVCNMPAWKRYEYPDDIALVGWGACFHKAHVRKALVEYRSAFEPDALFRRECDRVITGISPLQLIDVPFSHLPYAEGEERLGKQKEHGECLRQIRERIYAIRKQRWANDPGLAGHGKHHSPESGRVPYE